jgi:hypothetical protein
MEPEETVPAEPTTTESTIDPSIELLQSISDSLYWSISFQVVIMCVLLFILFFTALKGGKNQ